MLVLALCLMTKLLEYSSGRVLLVQDDPAPTQKRPRRRRARRAQPKAPDNQKQDVCDNRTGLFIALSIMGRSTKMADFRFSFRRLQGAPGRAGSLFSKQKTCNELIVLTCMAVGWLVVGISQLLLCQLVNEQSQLMGAILDFLRFFCWWYFGTCFFTVPNN